MFKTYRHAELSSADIFGVNRPWFRRHFERKLWVDSCRSRCARALVTSDANGWSSRMQKGGQVGCKRLVKSGAISHECQIGIP